MWWRRCCFVAAVLVPTACSLWEDDFPEDARLFVPPPQFRVWWEVLESCSGQRGRFDDVTWFQAAEIPVRGGWAFGAWFPAGNRIALLFDDRFDGPLVRHEMLHALLKDGDHPDEYFRGRCGDLVACGRDCPVEVIPSNPVLRPATDFDVRLELFPTLPSLARDNGRMTFVLNVTNRTDSNAFLDVRRLNHVRCPIGVLLTSMDRARSALACGYVGFGGLPRMFRGRETRRIAIDVHLQHLDPGEGPFFAEPLIAGAVLENNVRQSVPITVRP